MDRETARLLLCPGCRRDGMELHVFESEGSQCREGVLACPRCGAWYPIADLLLDLLPTGLASQELRSQFYADHGEALRELGLPAVPNPLRAGHDVRLQVKQQEYFDELADRADKFSYEQFMGSPFWRAVDQSLFDRWLPKIKPGSRILDVGCGNGRTTFHLDDGESRIVAFDISTKQVRRAVERARAEGVLDRFTFFVGDATNFPLRDETVGYVVMDGVLHHLPDPAHALHDTARVLTGGGLYFGKENNKTPVRPLFDWLQRLRPLWFEQAGPDPLISIEELEAWGAAAGMRVTAEPSVYLPPHLFGHLDEDDARRRLDRTDRLARRVPLFRRWGGLLVVEGTKDPAASPP